jgi:hypothetical protein
MASIGMSTAPQAMTEAAQSGHALQKAGSIAALIQGMFTALYLAVFLFVLPRLGFQESFFTDPPKFVAFVTAHYTLYYWLSLGGLLASMGLIMLVLGLHERLRASSPALSAAVSAFGYLVVGLLILNWSYQYAEFHTIGLASPTFAVQTVSTGVLYDATDNSAFLALGVWMLLLSWVALRRGGLAKPLAYVGVVADRVHEIQDWKQVSLLSVAADRLKRWYKPGLLLIGDAAHVMSPAGGNGINYAIMDAVASANLLTEPLKVGRVTPADLTRVQRRRELPTRIIQAIISGVQDGVINRALDPRTAFQLPLLFRLPLLRNLPLVRELPVRLIAFGIQREHVNPSFRRRYM